MQSASSEWIRICHRLWWIDWGNISLVCCVGILGQMKNRSSVDFHSSGGVSRITWGWGCFRTFASHFTQVRACSWALGWACWKLYSPVSRFACAVKVLMGHAQRLIRPTDFALNIVGYAVTHSLWALKTNEEYQLSRVLIQLLFSSQIYQLPV